MTSLRHFDAVQAISLAQFIGQSFAVILLTLEVVLKYVWVRSLYSITGQSEIPLKLHKKLWDGSHLDRVFASVCADRQALPSVQSQ